MNNSEKSLISLNCPNCGGMLEISSTEMKVNCKYCGTEILIKDFITERRVDKADRISSLKDMIENAVKNNDFTKAYSYTEEICKLDSAKENLARLNVYGLLCEKIAYSQDILDELYYLSPDEHRSSLNIILQRLKENKQIELKAIAVIANLEQRKAEAMKINNLYMQPIAMVNKEIKKMQKKRCKCGYMLEYNESICPECGLNYDEYINEKTASELAVKKAREKKLIKWSLIIGVPILIIVIIASIFQNSSVKSNIYDAIDDKDYAKAEQLIDDYQESHTSNTNPYEMYADLYLAQNQPEKAVKKLKEGMRHVSSSDDDILQEKIDEITKEYNLE